MISHNDRTWRTKNISLVDKLFKERLTDFLEFGMEEPYCGDLASATTEEGQQILEILSRHVVEDAEKLFLGNQALSIAASMRER
jgi:hypothetical protein